MKKIMILSLFLSSIVLLQGCETAKGFSQGLKKDASNTWHHITKSDGSVKKVDGWIEKNLW